MNHDLTIVSFIFLNEQRKVRKFKEDTRSVTALLLACDNKYTNIFF